MAESTCRIDLISSEGFWFCDPGEVKEQLQGVNDVRIVAYLRRQDQYLQSLYKQAVAGGRNIDFTTWLGKMRHRGNYLAVVERWVAQFGKDAITIRPYERGGTRIDSVEDFGSFLGCDLVEQRKKGKVRGNASPRRELLHFIRAFNKLRLEVDREEFFYSLIRKNSEYIRSADLLTGPASIALMQEYQEDNALLAERYYGTTKGPLFPEMEENVTPPSVWGLDDPAFFELTADVIDVIITLAAEGKIRSKRASANRRPEAVDPEA
ncbi:MAG TPA: hypothetical protein VHY79_14060 [Rhizomicrobium sp.]|nr:hypothetical protein [Rhizomicrobium sp.]